MKNIILLISSTILGLILGYLIFFSFFYLNFEKKFENTISSKEKFYFIKKYVNILNHVRPEYSDYSHLMYSVINDYKNKNNILFQGDSWFEQINFPANDNAESYKDVNLKNPKIDDFKSLNYIRDWSNSKNFGAINAGTGSYSPSLMSIQLEVLEKDFKIMPDILVAYIDQTDLGDENCRYKLNKVYSGNKLIRVEATKSLTRQAFDYTKMLKLSEINLTPKPKFFKVFYLTNYNLHFEINKFFKINYFKISQIINKGWDNRKIKKCNVDEILSYLKKPQTSQISYFKSSLEEYLARATKKNHIKKIYLVSFPHLEGLKKIYKDSDKNYLNISDIIDTVLEKNSETLNKKIYHINFSKITSLNNELFSYDDYLFDKAHLKQEPHRVFISEILNKIN